MLLLEATRRSTGWIMPVVALIFIAYALFGKYLPPPWTHRGYTFERLVGHLYMTLEGVFGTTVEVSSSLIILFTIFGAVLQYSGAGKFFIDFSFAAMGGKRNAAGRSVVLSSFLLGGPSGSGVATTVTIGTVAYPLLEKAGYDKNAAGGLLAAGGLGAIISPPVLGAAAFLIAEFLKISYLDVIWMAAIPTILYYFSILVMVELDAAKYGGGGELLVQKGTLWRITRSYWFHFGSLVSIIAFMLYGFSPVLSVFWATMLAIAVSYLRRDTALVPPKLVRALAEGTTGVLSIAATCATAGIIVGVTTLTGLAQRFADIIIGYAQGNLVLTALFSAAIVWVVGLAVPVTASYIMCAVIAAPALIKLGVPDYAAHMFIFYYAVLSEVSPPTALSPFAAAAITGGKPLSHHHAGLEIHHAGVPGAVCVRVRSARRGPAAAGAERRQLGRYRGRHCGDAGRHRHPCLRLPGAVPEEEHRAGDGSFHPRRHASGFPRADRRYHGVGARQAGLSAYHRLGSCGAGHAHAVDAGGPSAAQQSLITVE